MLTFYHHNKNSFTVWAEEKLDEMVVAHKVVQLSREDHMPGPVSPESLPALSDGHEWWTSEKEIRQYLEELHNDLKLSRSLQSDSCHIDPDNPNECL